jgi:Tfp pilus assembly protein PilO
VRLLGRIIVEKRIVLTLIAVAVAANVAVYGLWLHPLQASVSSGEARVAAAQQARRAAERELTAAHATDVGKVRAEADLETFYRRVLPAGFAEARKVAYVRLSQLASEANLRYERQTAEEVRGQKDSRLARLSMTLVLEGNYQDIRRFIHSVETAPEFLVIDNVALALRNEPNAPLLLTLAVSTYYRTGGNAT